MSLQPLNNPTNEMKRLKLKPNNVENIRPYIVSCHSKIEQTFTIEQNEEETTVQYRFYSAPQIKVILKVPDDISRYIQSFLKTKESVYYEQEYQHFCNVHYNIQNIYC